MFFVGGANESSCWHQFNAQLMDVRPQRVDEQGDDREVQVDGL